MKIKITLVALFCFASQVMAQCEYDNNVSSSKSRWIKNITLRQVTENGDIQYFVDVEFKKYNKDLSINDCDELTLYVVIPFSLDTKERTDNIVIMVEFHFRQWLKDRNKFKQELYETRARLQY